jgi:hypothetical protein
MKFLLREVLENLIAEARSRNFKNVIDSQWLRENIVEGEGFHPIPFGVVGGADASQPFVTATVMVSTMKEGYVPVLLDIDQVQWQQLPTFHEGMIEQYGLDQQRAKLLYHETAVLDAPYLFEGIKTPA